jgi:hypothetical protein
LEQPRRHLHKAVLALTAALEVIERHEDARLAVDDVEEAKRHLEKVMPTIRAMARGWARGADFQQPTGRRGR